MKLFKKITDRLLPKRFVQDNELADMIVDCFRMDNGNTGFRSQCFSQSGRELMRDNDGNETFYAAVYVDAATSRIDKLVKQLRNGEPVEQPTIIPKVRKLGYINRKPDATLIGMCRASIHVGGSAEMVWHEAKYNGLSVDLGTVEYLFDAIKTEKAMLELNASIGDSLIPKNHKAESDGN